MELLCFREKTSRREIRLLDALKFVHSVLWKYLFGRQARDLEQSNMVTPCMRAADFFNPVARQVPDPATSGRQKTST